MWRETAAGNLEAEGDGDGYRWRPGGMMSCSSDSGSETAAGRSADAERLLQIELAFCSAPALDLGFLIEVVVNVSPPQSVVAHPQSVGI